MVRPDDDEPTAEELREAEELRRLLDGDEVGERAFDARAPELEAGALLRYSQGAGELSAEREDAILRGLLDGAGVPEAPAATRPAARAQGFDWRAALRWFLGVGGLAAAAAIALLVLRPWEGAGATTATTLPPPSVALLRAQAVAASEGGSVEALAGAMRGYRTGVYSALRERYGAGQSAAVAPQPGDPATAAAAARVEGADPRLAIAAPRRRSTARARAARRERQKVWLAEAWRLEAAK